MASRLIDADALERSFQDVMMPDVPTYLNVITGIIKAMPTVDAEPVRRGWWINSLCSECGTYVHRGDANTYCPGCGAKMYGVIDDEVD